MENISNSTKRILKLFLGTYEGKVYNVDFNLNTKTLDNKYSFKVSENSLKVIHNYKDYIFVSGNDEIIHIYDMNKKEDKGVVVSYNGSIDNLKIVSGYMIATGDESGIPLWRMTDFQNVTNLKGHKKSITNFAVHSKGLFLISASKDNTMIIWDLTMGRKIFKYNFKDNLICNKILLFNKEKEAVLIFDTQLWLFNLFKRSENPDDWVTKKILLKEKILDAFAFKNKLVVFHSLGKVKFYCNLSQSDECYEMELEKPAKKSEEDYDIRIKFMNVTIGHKIRLLNVVYTNNQIYVYDMNKIIKADKETKVIKKFRDITLNISDRLTCLDTNLII